MRNSNKILLIAVGAILAFVLAFVLVMGLTTKRLIDRRGRTAQTSFTTILSREGATAAPRT
jgi:flagellar biogenesis protein FliO